VYGGGGKGGGGGGGSPAPYVPQNYTDPVNGMVFTEDTSRPGWAQAALNNEINTRKNQEQSDSWSKQAIADQATADKRTTFQTSRQNALDDARTNAVSAFQRQGVDPNQYMASDINPVLQRQFNSIQDLDPNPYGAFPTNLGGDIVNQVLGGKRTQASNQLNQLFTPTYAQNALPDTLINQYSGDLLSEQFNPLQTQLQNALKRRTLSDTGYGAATDLLGQKRSAAEATIGNLGRGILETDRGNLNDYISGARTTANSMNLADAFDPNTYRGGAESRVASDTANFGGALRNAIGGTKFADISELINAGGAAQGSLNPNASNPVGPTLPGGSPSSAAQDELAKSKRGLGSTGAF
jgi:hypothetical protein